MKTLIGLMGALAVASVMAADKPEAETKQEIAQQAIDQPRRRRFVFWTRYRIERDLEFVE